MLLVSSVMMRQNYKDKTVHSVTGQLICLYITMRLPLYVPRDWSKVTESRGYAVDFHLLPRAIGRVFHTLVLCMWTP